MVMKPRLAKLNVVRRLCRAFDKIYIVIAVGLASEVGA